MQIIDGGKIGLNSKTLYKKLSFMIHLPYKQALWPFAHQGLRGRVVAKLSHKVK